MVLWTIVGDALIVRSNRSLSSNAAQQRLENGALVEQVELLGDRLHFRLSTGIGPKEGWVSIQTKDKILATKVESEAGPASNSHKSESSATPDRSAQFQSPHYRAPPSEDSDRVPLIAGALCESLVRHDPCPAPGDRVNLLENNRWIEGCTVQEVIFTDVRSGETFLPSGSVLVRHGYGSDQSTWVTPWVQQDKLEFVDKTRKMNLQVGSSVYVWSDNGKRWYSGLVRSIANEDIALETVVIPKDSVLVSYSACGIKWIPLKQQPVLLRQLPTRELPTVEAIAAIVIDAGVAVAGLRRRYETHGKEKGSLHSEEIALQPLLRLEINDEVDIFVWYGDIFGYVYGEKKKDGSQGWFPGSIVRLIDRLDETTDKEVPHKPASSNSDGGAPLAETTHSPCAAQYPATQLNFKTEAESVEANGKVTQPEPSALSSHQTWMPATDPEKCVNGIEPRLATLLNKQRMKSEGDADRMCLRSVDARRPVAENSIAITDAGLAKRLEQQRAKIERLPSKEAV